jgi:hypothetical protein
LRYLIKDHNSLLPKHFQMSLWVEITNTALIGCERKAPSLKGDAGAIGSLLSQLDHNDREGALLGAAALMSLYERAGSLPSKDALPLPEACEPDAAPRCSDRAAIHLAMMLRGEYQELLPEWLTLAAATGKRAPEGLLPPLLEVGRLKPALRGFILPALGRRGQWLAAQNPDWNYAAPASDEQSWETGNHESRLAFLRKLRATETARSRELLASTWNEEKPDYRAEFLSVFEIRLSLDDEQMLESALDDRSKGVVRTATKLLIQLPQSRFCQRMIERARPLISLKKKSRGKTLLEVTPPETCDAAMSRDGISSKPPIRQAIGQKAWLLKQIVSLTPPSTWNQSLGLTTDELTQAALADKEWGELLLESWTLAAKHYQDHEWAGALFNMQGRKGFKVDLQPLFDSLPRELREKYLLASLRAANSLEEIYTMLQSCDHQWSGILSLAVLSALYQSVKKGGINDGWTWINLLNTIAVHLNPDQIPEALSQISAAVQKHSKSPNRLDHFLATLQFRDDMLKEINQ